MQEVFTSEKNRKIIEDSVFQMISNTSEQEVFNVKKDIDFFIEDMSRDFIKMISLLRGAHMEGNNTLYFINKQVVLKVFNAHEERAEKIFIEKNKEYTTFILRQAENINTSHEVKDHKSKDEETDKKVVGVEVNVVKRVEKPENVWDEKSIKTSTKQDKVGKRNEIILFQNSTTALGEGIGNFDSFQYSITDIEDTPRSRLGF
jgi:hypothetical protein